METIEKEITNSSQVKRVKYNEESKVLSVMFSTGKEYDYFDVPKEKFNGLLTAESVGKYLNSEIKPHYRFVMKSYVQ